MLSPVQPPTLLQIKTIISARPVRYIIPTLQGSVHSNLIQIKTNAVVPQNRIIKCGLLNIRSICNKTKGVLVNEIISDNQLDIFCLTETWLRELEYVSLNTATPPSHTNTHIPRDTGLTRGGGVAAIFNSSLIINPRARSTFKSFESLVLSLSHPSWKSLQPLLFVTVYRPPGAYTLFLSEFSEFLSSLILDSNRIILNGDLNIHVDVGTDSLNNAFSSLIDSLGFSQCVDKPTHIFNHTLDLVLVYGIEIEHLIVFPYNKALSDHYLITFEFTLVDHPPLKKNVFGRSISDSAINKFKEKIPSAINPLYLNNIEDFYTYSPSQIDCLVDSVSDSFLTTLDSIAPLKKRVIKQQRLAPWYNAETRNLKRASRKLEKKWRSSKQEESCTAWQNSLKIYKKALCNARATYYSSLIEENKNNPKFLFDTLATLTKSRSSIEQNVPLTLSSNDFMGFFNGKIKTIRNQIDDLLLSSPIGLPLDQMEMAVQPGAYLDSLAPIELSEFTSIITSSKSTTCLLDPVPTRLLKEVLTPVGASLLNMINLSLVTGYVPQSFKVAVIKPLLKKPTLDSGILANYRPISNLPFLSKILEKAVAKQLCDFLHNNNLFESFQSGFRAHHSTETALVKVANDILLASDNGLLSVLILLDLSAAFDTIDHSILLQRLEHLVGIRGDALKWFESYLSDRSQFVNTNDTSSLHEKVRYGVPQGSVLGPILFTLYMLPLGKIIRKHSIHFHCYADDTQLYLSMKPDELDQLAKFQACLKDIKSWMTSNYLLLNSDKTELIVLGPKHLRDELADGNFSLDGTTVTPRATVKNLGVTFDQDMSFQPHIKQITKIAFFHLRNIAKVRHILSQSDAEKLVHAFVTSRLDYCNSLLSGCPIKSINSLQLVQNAAARVLTGVRRRDHITPSLASLHWLPVQYRIEFKILLLTYKACNGLAPQYLKDLVSPRDTNRPVRPQYAKMLNVPKKIPKVKTGARAFKYQAPQLWNLLPVSVREADTLGIFKTRLKTFLYDKAYN